jgi:hypothetical protein
VHEHLTFVKHVYVNVNGDAIVMRLSFVLEEPVGVAEVGPSSYSSRIYYLFSICCSFSLRHVSCRTDTIRLVIRCFVIHAS